MEKRSFWLLRQRAAQGHANAEGDIVSEGRLHMKISCMKPEDLEQAETAYKRMIGEKRTQRFGKVNNCRGSDK